MTIYQFCPSTFFLMMMSTFEYAIAHALMHLLDRQNGAFGTGSVGAILNSTVQQIESELMTFILSDTESSLPRLCSRERADRKCPAGDGTRATHTGYNTQRAI